MSYLHSHICKQEVFQVKRNQFEENFGANDILERKKNNFSKKTPIILVKKHQAPGALAHRLQRRLSAMLPRPTYTPRIWKRRSPLYSNIGSLINFCSISFSIRATFCFPLGEANESWNPQMEKRTTFLFSNINFHYLKVFHPSTPNEKKNGKKITAEIAVGH